MVYFRVAQLQPVAVHLPSEINVARRDNMNLVPVSQVPGQTGYTVRNDSDSIHLYATILYRIVYPRFSAATDTTERLLC